MSKKSSLLRIACSRLERKKEKENHRSRSLNAPFFRLFYFLYFNLESIPFKLIYFNLVNKYCVIINCIVSNRAYALP